MFLGGVKGTSGAIDTRAMIRWNIILLDAELH
jgi:hypothetical protein